MGEVSIHRSNPDGDGGGDQDLDLNLSPAQAQALDALRDADAPLSSGEIADRPDYDFSRSSAHKALNYFADLDPPVVEIDADSWPRRARLIESRDVADEQQQEQDPTDRDRDPRRDALDRIAQSISSGEGESSPSNPKDRSGDSGEKSQARGGSSQSSSGWQGFDERPAAEWNVDKLEIDDADADVLADYVIEVAAEMGTKSQADAMSNLRREHVRALQASAFADLIMALAAIREQEEQGDKHD